MQTDAVGVLINESATSRLAHNALTLTLTLVMWVVVHGKDSVVMCVVVHGKDNVVMCVVVHEKDKHKRVALTRRGSENITVDL